MYVYIHKIISFVNCGLIICTLNMLTGKFVQGKMKCNGSSTYIHDKALYNRGLRVSSLQRDSNFLRAIAITNLYP